MRTFLASLGPVSMTPTLLYLAGVPGEVKPSSRRNLTSTFGADEASPSADAAETGTIARPMATDTSSSASLRAPCRMDLIEPPPGAGLGAAGAETAVFHGLYAA